MAAPHDLRMICIKFVPSALSKLLLSCQAVNGIGMRLISRTCDPQLTAILKAGAPQQQGACHSFIDFRRLFAFLQSGICLL
jgi:hypothetical protein